MLDDLKEVFKGTRQHLNLGISYMIPMAVIGGLFSALATALGGAASSPLAKAFSDISTIGMSLFIPIFAAYFAFAIADRPGIAPGFVTGMLATTIAGAGFIGGIVAGLLSGYVALILKKAKITGVIKQLWQILIPFFTALIVGLLVIFVVGPPIKALMGVLNGWLGNLSGASSILLGLVLGALMGVDFGGPINKVAFFFALGLLEQAQFAPMAMVMCSAPVASLGTGLATLFRPKLYDEHEKEFGKAALAIGGLIGFSEGALPFALNDYLRVAAGSIVGSAIAGGMAGLFGLEMPAPASALLGLFVFNKPLWMAVSVIVGSVVCALIIVLLKSAKKKVQPVEE